MLDVHASTNPHFLSHDLSATISIVVLDTEHKPSFTTLSYVWGANATEESPIITLHAHGIKSELRLTDNRFQALLHLRRKLGSYTIWDDSICIHQSLLAEKTHQLNQMGDIYAISDKSYIWLGQHSKQTEQSMQCVMINPSNKYIFRIGLGFEDTKSTQEAGLPL